ncbi:hypothetical protein DEO72_LG3g1038 [Vigna unguiculata]|uniref:Uncharacterized protein n=1 Tax=Vigna unguiculata TaxID=3917 RepID=A0A4D6LDW5_VIGUN|nr:hypothetical protein DEO72_LG3g1038 [Vigna unguiculata]
MVFAAAFHSWRGGASARCYKAGDGGVVVAVTGALCCRSVISGFHGWLRCYCCGMMTKRVQASESARERWWSYRCCSEQVLRWPWCRLINDGGGCVFADP